MEVRSAIQQIAVEHWRRYGYRRISEELRRRGMQVPTRWLRVMKSANCPSSVRELLPTCFISAHQFGREAPGFIGTCSFWLV
jgi:hypothetical protein